MGILLAILGICLALFSAGLALYSFTYTLIALQISMPPFHISGFVINAYRITALVLMAAAPLVFLIFGCRIFIKYKIIWGKVPIGDNISVTFHLTRWKKVILLGIFPDLGEVRAEVKYQYGESLLWQHNSVAEWKRKLSVEHPVPIGSKVTIKGVTTDKLITIFERAPNDQICTIHPDRHILPRQFVYMVSLIRESNGEILSEHSDSYEY